MSILGDLGNIIIGGLVGGLPGAAAVFTVEHGGDAIKVTVDVAGQIVKLGTDVFRAIPPEAFALGGDPLFGLLKKEHEDELIWLGQIAGNIAIFGNLYWPALGPAAATVAILANAIPLYITGKSLIGTLHHRTTNDQEWEMAKYIFRDSLYDRNQIILTNLGGIDGRAFVYPTGPLGPVYVNLGAKYVHNGTTPDGPALFHELTHVWQAKQSVLTEVFLYGALDREYDFRDGLQWRDYNLEQQAGIVEAWTKGAIERSSRGMPRVRNRFAIGTPLFRYINGNVRRSDSGAQTGNGRSAKDLLAEGNHRTMKDMHSESPPIWWP